MSGREGSRIILGRRATARWADFVKAQQQAAVEGAAGRRGPWSEDGLNDALTHEVSTMVSPETRRLADERLTLEHHEADALSDEDGFCVVVLATQGAVRRALRRAAL